MGDGNCFAGLGRSCVQMEGEGEGEGKGVLNEACLLPGKMVPFLFFSSSQ